MTTIVLKSSSRSSALQALREFELGGHLFDRLLKIADLQFTRKIGE